MTTTEHLNLTELGRALAEEKRRRLAATDRITVLLRAVEEAHRGGATVMRLDTIRHILAMPLPAPAQRRTVGRIDL